MAADAKHIPILCIDVQGFTTHNTETQRTIVRRLQRMVTEAARFFMPFGDPWMKWQRQGTGDGYYFPFDALSPQVALQYALNLDTAVAAHNAQHGQDLVLRLYGVLVLGDVELVGDQYLSSAFSEAARFLSHQPFKDYLDRQERPMVLAMSSLFHTEWRDDIERENTFPEATTLQWTAFRFRDKHGYEHRGYVLGPGWEQDVAVPADTTADVKPAPVSGKTAMPAESSAGAMNRGDAVNMPRYTGEVKLNVCRRLGPSWPDLADYLNIPPFERASFERGREPQGVWEWLEARQRLVELPQALVAIGRDDLVEILPRSPLLAPINSLFSYEMVNVELIIDRDFDSFSDEEKSRILRILRELLNLSSEIPVISIEPRSTKLTISLTCEQAEQLLWLFESGVIDDLNITDAKIIGNKTAEAIIRNKTLLNSYDVFMCHNSEDRPAVKRIALQLRRRGILPW